MRTNVKEKAAWRNEQSQAPEINVTPTDRQVIETAAWKESMSSKEKNQYRTTKHWKERVKRVKKRDKCCVMCGSKRSLRTHHLNSEGVSYTEDGITDLILVCNSDHRYNCHKKHCPTIENAVQQVIAERKKFNLEYEENN